jgi:hypothetical protein
MKTIRKPDLNAPRFRNGSTNILTMETLKEFKKKYPKYKDVQFKEFKDIITTFNQNIIDGVIDNRNGVELPEGLGFIFMGTCPKAKKKNIDYQKSLKYGVETTHKNWDSNNKLLKIFYTNRNAKHSFQNKQVWAFNAVRQFKRKASKAYRENWPMYIEVDPTQKISAMFDRHRKKEYMKNLKPIIPEGYDEFKL